MKIALIVAAARNGVIGGGNKMLWRVPEDFAHFKRTTMGHPIVMGRKTWESIGRPLPGRRNVVVTRNADYRAEGAEVVPSLEEAFRTLADTDTVFVLGGGEIYRQALPSADVVWLTKIDADFEGDTTFPELPESEWTTEVLEMLEPTESRSFAVAFCSCGRRARRTPEEGRRKRQGPHGTQLPRGPFHANEDLMHGVVGKLSTENVHKG